MAPVKRHETLVLHNHRTPHPFFTPTHVSFVDPHTGGRKASWNSRRARKGRYSPKTHTIHYTKTPSRADTDIEKASKDREERVESIAISRIKKEESQLKPNLRLDITFWLAVAFTLGSTVWVVNGFLVFLPILRPSLDTKAYTNSASATAFLGGSIFEVGAYLGILEVVDRGREIHLDSSFGKILHHRRKQHPQSTINPTKLNSQQSNVSDSLPSSRDTSQDELPNPSKQRKTEKKFLWWGKPMWHDMGYLAAIIQFFAATIFWVSTLTGLPGVIPGYSDGGGSQAIIDIFFWTPQVIGGTGFIISSLILMIEVQKKWYLPNLAEIGWWVGVWNLIGAIGFTLCGALGYPASSSKAEYQSGLSTFWGGWAFLFGSVCQVYEAIWREPESEPDSNSKSTSGS
ncbi:uncharacterized protein I303_100078 [Kwoniella dejecticola CBS 10117]|uniref:Integral membrane protein n=1 Tax=Kwoniella dejecticola CBS 10117 TaxID=1296121 RepID=A0A1A6ADX0_9TREE|nr:uncharacterized protein I303_00078 [Kwoniella dejecticola CBS 10117]OBR88267.1 hypothetical protein I303_00078 [Kwoniella dejecticola CBS 10117]